MLKNPVGKRCNITGNNIMGLKIKLNWMKGCTSVPEQMAAYADHFQIAFDGVERIVIDESGGLFPGME